MLANCDNSWWVLPSVIHESSSPRAVSCPSLRWRVGGHRAIMVRHDTADPDSLPLALSVPSSSSAANDVQPVDVVALDAGPERDGIGCASDEAEETSYDGPCPLYGARSDALRIGYLLARFRAAVAAADAFAVTSSVAASAAAPNPPAASTQMSWPGRTSTASVHIERLQHDSQLCCHPQCRLWRRLQRAERTVEIIHPVFPPSQRRRRG